MNKGVVSPLANLVDPGMLSSESPTHADDASLLVRSRASDDAMADHEHPDADRARDRGGSHEDGSVDSSAPPLAARDTSSRDFPNEKLRQSREVQYEKSPLAVWMGMLVNLLASALAGNLHQLCGYDCAPRGVRRGTAGWKLLADVKVALPRAPAMVRANQGECWVFGSYLHKRKLSPHT